MEVSRIANSAEKKALNFLFPFTNPPTHPPLPQFLEPDAIDCIPFSSPPPLPVKVLFSPYFFEGDEASCLSPQDPPLKVLCQLLPLLLSTSPLTPLLIHLGTKEGGKEKKLAKTLLSQVAGGHLSYSAIHRYIISKCTKSHS